MDEKSVLAPYRARIDELDDRIVDLLVQRIGIIREVALIKHQEKIPAVLQDRVDEVRERAAARADEYGLDADLVRKVYTLLIDYSCGLEDRMMAELRAARQAVGGRP